jgi:hypothetical protein
MKARLLQRCTDLSASVCRQKESVSLLLNSEGPAHLSKVLISAGFSTVAVW